ncbi:hypothetical protein HX307_004990 [Salmonella enterica]|nr:hypothetical protein [Salmonella enterica]
MAQTRVYVINEATDPATTDRDTHHTLWLQWCRYVYDDGESEMGYRFIWKKPNGNLLPSRGQARLPSISCIQRLINEANNQGWGNNKGDYHFDDL